MKYHRLGEMKGEIEPWENPGGNEAGLDLLFYRPFPDNRVGVDAMRKWGKFPYCTSQILMCGQK